MLPIGPYPGRMARSKSSDTPAPSGKAGRGPGGGGRGRGAAAAGGKGATASGKAKKGEQPKEGRIKKFVSQLKLVKQAYSLTRKNDPKLPWILLITFVGVAAVVELIGVLVLGSPYLLIPL